MYHSQCEGFADVTWGSFLRQCSRAGNELRKGRREEGRIESGSSSSNIE